MLKKYSLLITMQTSFKTKQASYMHFSVLHNKAWMHNSLITYRLQAATTLYWLSKWPHIWNLSKYHVLHIAEKTLFRFYSSRNKQNCRTHAEHFFWGGKEVTLYAFAYMHLATACKEFFGFKYIDDFIGDVFFNILRWTRISVKNETLWTWLTQ